MSEVWVFKNGDTVIFRGSLVECAEAWSTAKPNDKWHGSVSYESGTLTYDQQFDRLCGVVDFMEDPESGWKEPPDFEPMREEARKLGRACAESLDTVISEALRRLP